MSSRYRESNFDLASDDESDRRSNNQSSPRISLVADPTAIAAAPSTKIPPEEPPRPTKGLPTDRDQGGGPPPAIEAEVEIYRFRTNARSALRPKARSQLTRHPRRSRDFSRYRERKDSLYGPAIAPERIPEWGRCAHRDRRHRSGQSDRRNG